MRAPGQESGQESGPGAGERPGPGPLRTPVVPTSLVPPLGPRPAEVSAKEIPAGAGALSEADRRRAGVFCTSAAPPRSPSSTHAPCRGAALARRSQCVFGSGIWGDATVSCDWTQDPSHHASAALRDWQCRSPRGIPPVALPREAVVAPGVPRSQDHVHRTLGAWLLAVCWAAGSTHSGRPPCPGYRGSLPSEWRWTSVFMLLWLRWLFRGRLHSPRPRAT